MEALDRPTADPAADKLADEVADVRASITLVAEGVASRITLTGMRFGQQVTQRLAKVAALQGVRLEASFWPEDVVCDVTVSRVGNPPDATESLHA